MKIVIGCIKNTERIAATPVQTEFAKTLPILLANMYQGLLFLKQTKKSPLCNEHEHLFNNKKKRNQWVVDHKSIKSSSLLLMNQSISSISSWLFKTFEKIVNMSQETSLKLKKKTQDAHFNEKIQLLWYRDHYIQIFRFFKSGMVLGR